VHSSVALVASPTSISEKSVSEEYKVDERGLLMKLRDEKNGLLYQGILVQSQKQNTKNTRGEQNTRDGKQRRLGGLLQELKELRKKYVNRSMEQERQILELVREQSTPLPSGHHVPKGMLMASLAMTLLSNGQ
jgi:hypothetical protein